MGPATTAVMLSPTNAPRISISRLILHCVDGWVDKPVGMVRVDIGTLDAVAFVIAR